MRFDWNDPSGYDKAGVCFYFLLLVFCLSMFLSFIYFDMFA